MAFFTDSEIILYLSENKVDKQYIEDSINRDLITIRTIKSLVEEIQVGIKKYSRVNLICTTKLPKELQQNLAQIVYAVDTFPTTKVTVFEIGYEHPLYKEAIRFGTLADFCEYAINQRREEYVNTLEKSDSEKDLQESIIFRKLLTENNGFRDKIEILNSEIEKHKDRIKELEDSMTKTNSEVNSVYKVRLSNFENEVQNLKDNIEDLEREILAEQNKNRKYLTDLNEYRDKNIDLESQLEAHNRFLKEKREELRSKDKKITRLENDLELEKQEKIKIIEAKVDAEVVVDLSRTLENKKQELIRAESEVSNLEILLRKSNLNIKELQERIEDMRKGEFDLNQTGFTKMLDTCELQTTNVIYFKIIHDLPYLNSHIANFKELLEEQHQKVQVLILKNDEGVDSKRYKKIPYYGSIDSVSVDDIYFRLKPSHTMFNNVNQYEGKIQTLIVLDYIQSSDYYISSTAINRVFTVTKTKDLMVELGLKGNPITLDSATILNLTYDSQLALATTQQLKHKMIRNKVQVWINSSDLNGLLN